MHNQVASGSSETEVMQHMALNDFCGFRRRLSDHEDHCAGGDHGTGHISGSKGRAIPCSLPSDLFPGGVLLEKECEAHSLLVTHLHDHIATCNMYNPSLKVDNILPELQCL